MKITFSKYLFLAVALLLNAFAGWQANEVTGNIEDDFIVCNLKVIPSSVENPTYQNITSKSFNQFPKETGHKFLFGLIESEEVENEELSSKHKSQYTDSQETAFINAKLFVCFSKELEKNIQRLQRVVYKPHSRLHLQYQVFII